MADDATNDTGATGVDLDALAAKLAPLIDQSVDKRVGAVARQFGEKVDGLASKLDGLGKPADTDSDTTGTADTSGNVPPEVAALKRQQEQLQRQLEEAKAEREAERKAAAWSRAEQAAADALRKHGVREELVGDRVAAMRHSGQLALTDDMQPVVMGAPAFDGGDPQPLPVAAGIEEWAKTDDAKVYRAPQPGSGSGGQAGDKPPARSGGKIDWDQLKKPISRF